MSRKQALDHGINTFTFVALLLLVGALVVCPPPTSASLEDHGAANVLIIRFEPGVVSFPPEVDSGDTGFILPTEDADFTLPTLETALEGFGVLTFETIAPGWRHLEDRAVYDRHGNRVHLVDFTDVYRATFDESEIPNDGSLIDLLQNMPGIAYAEHDLPIELFSTPLQDSFPDDSLFSEQWALHNTGQTIEETTCDPYYDINGPEAWQIWDSAGTKIGIMDKGIYDEHEDLEDYIDRDLSKSFVPNKEWYDIGIGDRHGTGVAGIAAAGGNNGKGVASIANLTEDSLIVALRIVPSLGGGGWDSLVARSCRALEYITTSPVYGEVLVANQSGGTSHYKNCFSYSPTHRDAFRNAFLMDINLVVSAGNDSTLCDHQEDPCPSGPDTCFTYPAGFDDYSLAVTALPCDGEWPTPGIPEQNMGSFIDLSAPGHSIYTTDIDSSDAYGFFEATSAAAPHAAGAIALLLGRDPDLTNEDCYHLLEVAAAPLDLPSVKVGHGFIKVDSALAAVTYPGAVIRDSVFADDTDTTFVEEREQKFKNLPGWSWFSETWALYTVEVYKLEVTAFLWDDDYASIDTLWIRGKLTEGAKNITTPYDANFHAGYAELKEGTFDGEKATLRTYVYKIFDDEGDSLWFPKDPADDIRIDYSVLLRFDVGSSKAAPPSTSIRYFRPERLPSMGRATIRLGLGRPGTYTLSVYDVMGRRVRRIMEETRLPVGEHRLVWDGRDSRRRPAACGLYFARLKNNAPGEENPIRTARLLLLR